MERFGDYLLIRNLAKGRITQVFKAKPVGVRGFTDTVALHRVRPPFDENEEFLKVLSSQAHLAAALDHPKVVRILDQGLDGEQPYLVTEYLPGRDLLDLMVRCASMHRRLPISTACRIAIEVLEGLSAAHRFEGLGDRPQAILHGGLTPGCVLFGFNGRIKVSGFGFGLAIAVARALARDLHVMQAAYSSPEVARHHRVTPASDIFSLGLILAELLTLKPMYPRKDPAELEERITTCRWERKNLEPLPPPLRGFIKKMLAEDAEARYPSAMAARTALLEVLGVRPGEVSQKTLGAAAQALFKKEIEAEEAENREVEAELENQVEHASANVSDHPQQVEVDVLPLSAMMPASGVEPIEPEPTNVVEVALPMAGASEEISEASEVSWADVQVPEFVTGPTGEIQQVEPSEIRRDLEAGRRRPHPPPTPADALEAHPTIEAIPEPDPPPKPVPRAPAPPAAAEADPTLSGDLARRSLAGLLHRLAVDDRSGRLELRRDPVVKSFFIKGGHVEYVRSNVESEFLGEFLVKRGAITRTYLEKALGDAAVRHCTFTELLLAEKIMAPHDLARLMTEQNRERVLSCFEWAAARFAFFDKEEVQAKRVPLTLELYDLIAEGVRERVPSVIVELALKADWLSTPVLKGKPPEQLNFTAAEQRVIQAVDGKQMLQDVVMTAGGGAEEIVRVIYLLQEIDCLRFRQLPPHGA